MQRGSSFISSRSSTKWEQMIWFTSTSPVILRTGQASSFDIWRRECFFYLFFFQDIKTRFPLWRAVVIATHWLAERVGGTRSHWTWLTSHDWVNEATWQRRLIIWFVIFGGGHFLAPEMARQLSFFFFTLTGSKKCLWLEHILLGSLAVREKHLINLIFIMWLSLLIYAQDTRMRSSVCCSSLGNANQLDARLSKLCFNPTSSLSLFPALTKSYTAD